ncbi:TIR domain-containing protein [Mycobacterium deserti]|uniref:TIR domain-containing protein n=1 Tax=Mycobacterium deserti TaxID=2978347 RepID=UPI0021B60471|nr:TIR domain-containing protein [Mycobacterium deserti]
MAATTVDPTRHKCFISYHAADVDEVAAFIDSFGTEFIAKTVGVTDEDDFIDSEDSDYIMDQIRTKYLGNSTVTIALMGKCTWARRYVDWEIYSSLRDSKLSKVNGLLAIQLPSGGDLQARINDNVKRTESGVDKGYARSKTYPTSKSSLRSWISDAFTARTSRDHLIDNSRARRLSSASCF